MKTYIVWAKETVYYRYEVEAENYDQACEKANDYPVTENDITESDWFEVFDIEETDEVQA